MERWAGRVALVTGASSGIGAAVAKELVKKGLKVVGIARRVERVEELATSLSSEPGKLYALKCDVSNKEEVEAAFQWIKSNLEGVDILVNNAGSVPRNSLSDGPIEAWQQTLDVNVVALSVCTKEALQSMRERGVDDGHIIHMNSLAGHVIPPIEAPIFMYAASKHAVTALTEGLRRELANQQSKIRVTSISPGVVDTEMTTHFIAAKEPHISAHDIADAILYVLATPPHVQVHELTIMPVGQRL